MDMSDDANANAAGQEPRKVVLQDPAKATVKPSSLTQVAPAAGAPAEAAPAADGRRTIKLKPMKTASGAESEDETVSMDRSELEPGVTAPKGNDEDAATVKIEKPARSAAAVKPVLPGAKQTIKLRPSAGTVQGPSADEAAEAPKGGATIKVKPAPAPAPAPEPEAAADDGVQQTKKTIRLVPKKAAEAPAKPSDPTTKLDNGENEDTAALARPAAPTVQLPEEPAADDMDATIPEGAAASKKTLKLRTTKLKAAAPPAPAATAPAGGGEPGDTDTGMEPQPMVSRPMPQMASGAGGADEGHIAFAIAAIVALLMLAYFTWMTVGQFGEQYLEWQSANVPGLSGVVK